MGSPGDVRIERKADSKLVRLVALVTDSVKVDLTVRVAADELVLGLWLDPGRLLTFASLLRRTLEQVPLVSRRRLRYWQDVETLLRPLEGLELVAIEARQSHQVPSAGADRVRLRLVDRTLVN